MKRIILCICVFFFIRTEAQQINPVPDYVFSNKMSVGRNAVTDTAAYFSIGPRYGAIRGMMPPMVTDTASMSATKRNGLLIFSIQKNKYLYWDSVGSKWAEMAGTAGSAITGTGVAGYMPEFTTATNLDTTRLYHTLGRFGIGTTSPLTAMHVNDELMASKILVDTPGGLAINSTYRTSGVRNNFSGVSHWWGKTDGTGVAGGGDFTFFKSRRGDSALVDGDEVWYLAFYGKYRNNHTLWYNNDSSYLGNYIVKAKFHTNGTPTSQQIFRYKNSSASLIDALVLDGKDDKLYIGSAETLINTTSDAGNFALQTSGSAYISNELLVGTSADAGAFNIQSVNMYSRDYILVGNGSGNKYIQINSGAGTGVGGALYMTNGATDLSYYGHASYVTSGSINNNGTAIVSFANNFYVLAGGATSSKLGLMVTTNQEVMINTTTDAGAYALQVAGAIYNTTTITTGAPTSGTAKPWRLGEAATVSPTSPNRTIRVEIDGTVYYIHAKTTND